MKPIKFVAVAVVAFIVASVIGWAEAIYMHSNNIKIECIGMPQLLVGSLLLIAAGPLYDGGKKTISKLLVVTGAILVFASINIINVAYTL